MSAAQVPQCFVFVGDSVQSYRCALGLGALRPVQEVLAQEEFVPRDMGRYFDMQIHTNHPQI